MPDIACAQKLTAAHPAADPDFTPQFYRPYEAAAKTALLLLEDARAQLQRQSGENAVCALTFRLKSPASIRGKLIRKGLPVSTAAAGAALRDIAGLRVVLASEDAIYSFAQLVCASPVCELIGTHDYIRSPKPSGYRSLHLLLRVPVCLRSQAYMVPVEIQLRTSPMDVWASIEHQLCYKPVRHA